MKYKKTYFKNNLYKNKKAVKCRELSGDIKLEKLSELRIMGKSDSLLKIGWNHKTLVDMYYLRKMGVSFDFLN